MSKLIDRDSVLSDALSENTEYTDEIGRLTLSTQTLVRLLHDLTDKVDKLENEVNGLKQRERAWGKY